jgi:hypothetical protein
MNLTWLVLGLYGLLGAVRFIWAMSRKASLRENQEAQSRIRSFSKPTLFIVCLFEVFLWPVELAIGAYIVWFRKPSARTAAVSMKASLHGMPKARSCYDCSDCGARFEGFPPTARADGRPLCVGCGLKHLRTRR